MNIKNDIKKMLKKIPGSDRLESFYWNHLGKNKAASTAADPIYNEYLQYCMHHLQVFIEISSKCNFRCFYCKSKDSKRKIFMSDDLFYHIIDQLDGLTDQPIRLHMDGEPLLHKKFPEYARAINARGHKIALATNGSLLKKEYLDIDMSVLVNLSVSREELRKRSLMNFETYIKTLSGYVESWKKTGGRQNIIFGVYTSGADRAAPERLQEKSRFLQYFLQQCGISHGQDFDYAGKNLFSFRNQGGGSLRLAHFHITSGGVYPSTEKQPLKSSLPDSRGFCDSPWKRLVILADGRLAYCCLDVTGSLAYTQPGEIWRAPIKTLFWDHPAISSVRADFLSARVQHPTCRLCLNRIPSRTFEAGFQVPFDSFVRMSKK